MDKQIKSIRLEEETIEKIERLAEEEGRTFSNMVERILRQYLEKLEES